MCIRDRCTPQPPPRQRSRLTHLRYGRETGGGTCGKAETPTDTDGRPKLQKAHRRYSISYFGEEGNMETQIKQTERSISSRFFIKDLY